MQGVGRPKQHGEQMRAALLGAAAELLQSGGRSAVSARRVADAAGTTTRAVYSLFTDMDGLVRELSTDMAETMRRHHESVPERTDPVAEVVELAFSYRSAALEKPKLYSLFLNEAVGRNDLNALAYRSFDRVLRTVRRCLAAGRFHDRDEFEIGLNLFAVVHGLASLELRGVLGDDDTARRVWRQSIDVTLAGLQQPPAPNRPRKHR
jgi:AcrR family transcriptional regulator